MSLEGKKSVNKRKLNFELDLNLIKLIARICSSSNAHRTYQGSISVNAYRLKRELVLISLVVRGYSLLCVSVQLGSGEGGAGQANDLRATPDAEY